MPAACGLSSFMAGGLGLDARFRFLVPHLQHKCSVGQCYRILCGRTKFRKRVALSG